MLARFFLVAFLPVFLIAPSAKAGLLQIVYDQDIDSTSWSDFELEVLALEASFSLGRIEADDVSALDARVFRSSVESAFYRTPAIAGDLFRWLGGQSPLPEIATMFQLRTLLPLDRDYRVQVEWKSLSVTRAIGLKEFELQRVEYAGLFRGLHFRPEPFDSERVSLRLYTGLPWLRGFMSTRFEAELLAVTFKQETAIPEISPMAALLLGVTCVRRRMLS